MKFLSRFAIAVAFSLGSLGAQASQVTFDELARGDLYELVSTSPSRTASPTDWDAFGSASNSQATVSWSVSSAAVAPSAYGQSAIATPIPEPQTYALMLAGIGVMTMVALRRRRTD
jgi:PEP-CTERM motif